MQKPSETSFHFGFKSSTLAKHSETTVPAAAVRLVLRIWISTSTARLLHECYALFDVGRWWDGVLAFSCNIITEIYIITVMYHRRCAWLHYASNWLEDSWNRKRNIHNVYTYIYIHYVSLCKKWARILLGLFFLKDFFCFPVWGGFPFIFPVFLHFPNSLLDFLSCS